LLLGCIVQAVLADAPWHRPGGVSMWLLISGAVS
jgi:hypothetical protein